MRKEFKAVLLALLALLALAGAVFAAGESAAATTPAPDAEDASLIVNLDTGKAASGTDAAVNVIEGNVAGTPTDALTFSDASKSSVTAGTASAVLLALTSTHADVSTIAAVKITDAGVLEA
ncbi:MAG: hypothetical protein IJ667_04475, partial [Synergistaceae bacterium]|nr:hypothetical protein [Synergistaceae bacterium]